jgi:hypothetical protein
LLWIPGPGGAQKGPEKGPQEGPRGLRKGPVKEEAQERQRKVRFVIYRKNRIKKSFIKR